MIEVNQIIKNLIPTEPVTVIKVQALGNMYSIRYTGVTTNKTSSKVITKEQFESLEVLTSEGEFNFKGNPEKFVMYAEAERIHSAYQFDPLFAINCSVVDPLPHQVEAVYKFLLPQPKIRFLLADDTGAGKTIMTGLLLKELIMRGIVERILIITPGGLTKQWQEDEMGVKFNIPFTLVNRSLFTADPNIFRTANKIVTSIDFISREDVLSVVSNTSWDMVIFDESHKLSAYEYGQKTYKSKRYETAYVLSQQCEHMLLLTATPHRGRTDTFKKLLQLLDEDIFATDDVATERVKELSKDGLNKFFIRRLKGDMKDWNGNPLYKNRFTKTISYQLTPEEKYLYDQVTNYLTQRKEEATEEKNIHVTLALAVMQRRLVSSIFAIKNTLFKRWNALQGIVDEVNKNPNIWKQRQKLELVDVDNMDQYDDLEDDEKDALDNILSDPKKFKLFTTSKSLGEIANEAQEVKRLYDIANQLYNQNQEEKKYIQLKELLKSQGVIYGQKLVIFTEHKDTLLYLQERLTNNGYKVAVIHGGLSVDDRRASQWQFMAPDTQILIATDAAGEGINLQFCRLLINWDIPWNPNRLEQRMGRIHRYVQKEDVLVFNMVADNTREGQVLSKLLTKLDIIRESMGDDRVYDVIQDVLKDVSLEAIISSVFDGKKSDLDLFLNQNNQQLESEFKNRIEEQQNAIAHSEVDYKDARILKEDSDEKRLQPIYIQLFFERAFRYLGGQYDAVQKGIYKITSIPDILSKQLKESYNILADNLSQLLFCFDKQIFLDYQNTAAILGKVHYINPGNALFDALVDCVRKEFKEEMLKGTILVSPEDTEEYFAFFVKNQITDNRPNKGDDSIANELLSFIYQTTDGSYHSTSPAKFLDLHAPSQFAKEILPPETVQSHEVMSWAFENITLPLFEETKVKVEEDSAKRQEYLRTAFSQIIMDLDIAINEMQMKAFMGDMKLQEKLLHKIERKKELMHKREERIAEMGQMTEVSPKEPEIIGCAYVVPLSQVEYEQHFHMKRDEEVEAIAMQVAMEYETSQGRTPGDVSKQNLGYDIKSIDAYEMKRYIEVKGRATTDGVMLSENEWNRLAQLGNKAWLYIVVNCKTTPELYRIQNPAERLSFEKMSKGVQYYLPLEEWQQKYIKKLTAIFDTIEYQTSDVVSVMFAHQSTEAWTTLCNSILGARMNITGSWPMDTEMANRSLGLAAAALESSVTVSCRPSERNGFETFKRVKKAIETKVTEEVNALYELGFRGADLLTACFGQAVSEFGKYETVEKADGSEVTVGELLELARTAAFNALLRGFDGDEYTRFYIGWLQMNGIGDTDFDDAAKFARVGMSVNISDIFDKHLLIRTGNKQHLATYKERVVKDKLGIEASDPLIDQVHRAMDNWHSGDRGKLLRHIKVVGSEASSPFWRVLASLKELLPEGDDLTQVQGLISNSADLIQHCSDEITYTQGTLFE